MHQFLEAAVSHALEIEQRLIKIHHLLKSGISHDLLVGPVSMFTRFKNRPRKDHGFIGMRLDELRKRGVALIIRLQVIADALPVIECAVFFPNQRRLLGDPPIFFDAIFRHWQHEAIDVSTHGLPRSMKERAESVRL